MQPRRFCRGLGALLLLASALLPCNRAFAQQQVYKLMKDAQAAEASKNYAAAIKALQKALELDPRNHHCLGYLSHVQGLAQDYKAALANAKRAIALKPDMPWYYVSAAYHAYGLHETPLMIEYGRKALALGRKELGQPTVAGLEKLLSMYVRPAKEMVLTWKLDPAKGPQAPEIFVPVPALDLPYQQGKYSVTKAAGHRELRLNGNLVLAIRPKGREPFELKVTLMSLPQDISPRLAKRSIVSLPEEVRPYLKDVERITPSRPAIKKVAEQVRGPDDVATVNNTLVWIKKNLKYQWPHDHTGPSDQVLERGYGCCGCLSELFVAVCRANGIPARCLRVGVDAYNIAGELAGHTDAEVYLSGIGWVCVLPQMPGSLGYPPDRWVRWFHYGMPQQDARLFTAESLLPAAQQGTGVIYYTERMLDRKND